ncbi:MAG: hypothetical protein AAF598_11695, partial [Bacteroidota bacterium]
YHTYGTLIFFNYFGFTCFPNYFGSVNLSFLMHLFSYLFLYYRNIVPRGLALLFISSLLVYRPYGACFLTVSNEANVYSFF